MTEEALAFRTKLATVALVAAVFLFFFTPQRLISDFWWHLATGRWIASHLALPAADPFLYTGGALDLRQVLILKGYWLAQLLYFGVFSLASWPGLVLLKAAVFACLYGLLTLYLRNNGLNRWACAAIVFFSLLFSMGYDELRPQVFSFLGSMLVFVLLETWREATGRGAAPPRSVYWGLPVVLLLWGNLHPGFLLGDAIIALYLLFATVDRFARGRIGRNAFLGLLLSATAAIALSFCSPVHINLLKALVGATNFGAGEIVRTVNEFYPPHIYYPKYDLQHIWYALLGFAILLGLSFVLAGKRSSALHLVLALALAALAFSAFRFVLFFTVIGSAILGRNLAAVKGVNLHGRRWLWAASAALALAPLVPVFTQTTSFRHGFVMDGKTGKVAEYLRANAVGERIFNPYEWGGYLIWNSGEGRRFFIDARALDPEVYAEYLRILKGRAASVFEKYAVDSVVSYNFTPGAQRIPPVLFSLLRSAAWNLVYYDEHASVFSLKQNAAQPPADKNAFVQGLLGALQWQVANGRGDAETFVDMARLHLLEENRSAAVAALQKAAELAPQNGFIRQWLASMQTI